MESTTIAGISVSPIGLGTSRLASLGARNSLGQATRLLDVAFDLGVTFIDTADTYRIYCMRALARRGDAPLTAPVRYRFEMRVAESGPSRPTTLL